MTDSMIPYSFIPGTKAKANEVNANFLALATLIESYKSASSEELNQLSTQIMGMLQDKADKSELNKSEPVTETGTDIDDYSKAGTYVFSSEYTPLNIPKGESGTLITIGDKETSLKQIWICDGENPEFFIRSYKDEAWQSWDSTLGMKENANVGYMKLPNDFKIQWGWRVSSKKVTYPIAFTTVAASAFNKHGYANVNGDMGYSWQGLTGFNMDTVGWMDTLNWIAVGF